MKETNLWGHLKPFLDREGKFQKISDRFTPGVADVLGCHKRRGYALELKELKLKDGCYIVSYRPGQIRFLQDWKEAGGVAMVICSYGLREIYAVGADHAAMLEAGVRSVHGYARVREMDGNYKRFVENLLRERS